MNFKLTFLWILIIPFIISCKTRTEKTNNRELIPNPEKYEHDGYSQIPDSLKPSFIADTLIGRIGFLNSKNVSDYLGDDIMDRLNDEDLPNTSVLSHDRAQQLKIYFHPGCNKNEFSEFEVFYNKLPGRTTYLVDDSEFITESGIKLGITIGDLKSIKGEPIRIDTKETHIYKYEIIDSESSDFLKRYNLPRYYSEYEFDNGYLIRFKFGFEYP